MTTNPPPALAPSLDEQIEFNIYQPMISALGELAKHSYHMVTAKGGRRWLYSSAEASADQVFVDGGKGSQGMAGRTVTFELVDGTTVDFIGPWKTGADSLYEDTGVDIRDKYLTQGIVSTDFEYLPYPKTGIYKKILHYDREQVLGTFNRITDLAQHFANSLGVEIYFAVVSQGGGCSGTKKPKLHAPKEAE